MNFKGEGIPKPIVEKWYMMHMLLWMQLITVTLLEGSMDGSIALSYI